MLTFPVVISVYFVHLPSNKFHTFNVISLQVEVVGDIVERLSFLLLKYKFHVLFYSAFQLLILLKLSVLKVSHDGQLRSDTMYYHFSFCFAWFKGVNEAIYKYFHKYRISHVYAAIVHEQDPTCLKRGIMIVDTKKDDDVKC